MDHSLLDLILINKNTHLFELAFSNIKIEELNERRQDTLGIRVFQTIVKRKNDQVIIFDYTYSC
jgi:hypothetical protein